MGIKLLNFLVDGKSSESIFILAHGAGAPMDSEWMSSFAKELAKHQIKVIRFEFPYMIERRETGKKRPPNTKKVLIQTWVDVYNKVKADHPKTPLFIGGKSMGGRIASLVTDELMPAGLIGLGFPFHAPGKDVGDRIDHLENIQTKSLIIQGTRDSMGSKIDCLNYDLSKNIEIFWLEDGDHSWKPRKKSGLSLDEHMLTAAKKVKYFIKENK